MPPASPEGDDRHPRSGEPTRLLRRLVGGDKASADALFEVVYAELLELARHVMASERDDHTLQPTALVHEAFVRLIGMEEIEVRGRDQFMSLAARAMRRVLVDHARGRARSKRGGAWERVLLEDAVEASPSADGGGPDLLALDVALERLAQRAPRQARLVELRYFGGLPSATVARLLDLSEATVEREWRAARAWLSAEIERTER